MTNQNKNSRSVLLANLLKARGTRDEPGFYRIRGTMQDGRPYSVYLTEKDKRSSLRLVIEQDQDKKLQGFVSTEFDFAGFHRLCIVDHNSTPVYFVINRRTLPPKVLDSTQGVYRAMVNKVLIQAYADFTNIDVRDSSAKK